MLTSTMNSPFHIPCFASTACPISPSLFKKRCRSVDLQPRMSYGQCARRQFLKYIPVAIALAPTSIRAQSAAETSATLTKSTSSSGSIPEVDNAQDTNDPGKEPPNPDIDPGIDEPTITDRAYVDISINNQPSRRLTFALYGTIAPKTVANFLTLCENGYADTKVYRIVPGLTVQLGDVLNNNGKSGRAATDSGWLEAENFRITHSIPGIVSMVTKNGKVDSRFFVATRKGDSRYLDGKYVAFGRVVEGMEFLDQVERAGDGFVKKPVRVVASGVVR